MDTLIHDMHPWMQKSTRLQKSITDVEDEIEKRVAQQTKHKI